MSRSLITKYFALSLSMVLLTSPVNASYLYGDVNGDGIREANDAAYLLSYVLDKSSVDIPDESIAALDLNKDNIIDSSDCAEIMAKTLDGSYEMPVERDETTSGPATDTTISFQSTTTESTSQQTETTTEASSESITETTTESTTADLNSISASGYTFTIGASEADLPAASSVRITPDNIRWYGYDSDYLHYTRVGVYNGTVVKIVTYDASAEYDGIHIGDILSDNSERYIDYSYTRVSESRLYIDTNDNSRVYAIMLTSRTYYTSSLDYTPEKSRALAMLIADDTNAFRAQHSIRDLTWNPDVADVAQAYAEFMAEESYFDHVDPDGQNPGDRLESAGLIYYYYGENINAGYYDAEDSMNGWINSPGHRDNLLNTNFTQIGVGTAYNPDDTFNWCTRYVQNFFTPL